MSHASEGLLQAYVDGEVTGEEETSLAAHVAACHECGRELDELRAAAATFTGALGVNPVTAAAVAEARARVLQARSATVVPITSARTARFAAGSLARAAGLILVLAGGVAAMIPGSPLRRWIGERIAAITSQDAAEKATPSPATTPVVTPRRDMVPGAEMSIAAVGGKVTINLMADSPSGELVVRLVDAEHATVQADSSAHAVAFRTAPGSMEVLNLGSADAAVLIPRTLRHVEIDVNGTHFLVKDGDALRVTGPVARRTETEIVFQSGS
jgi:anti-sigma factor RsiW